MLVVMDFERGPSERDCIFKVSHAIRRIHLAHTYSSLFIW